MRNSIDLWTPYGGWIRPRGDTPYGYNVTRRVLDPLLRRLAAETPGVELLPAGRRPSCSATGGRPASSSRTAAHARRELRARLVVAADGRDSRIARLAGVPGRVRPHNRFFYWAYWRGVPSGRRPRRACGSWSPTARTRSPTRTACASCSSAPHRDRLPEFRADLEGAYLRYRRGAARRAGPEPRRRASRSSSASSTCRTSARPAARPGLAFVGDAALAVRPAVGRRLRLGVPERRLARARRRPTRWSAAATSTRRSAPTGACTGGGSARTTS